MAVTDEAILKIKDMLLSGALRPGDRLPPEKDLSDSLGLSRNSLREAVKALELIRVLDVRRGDGTYVTSLEPRLLLEAMSFVVDLHQDHTVLDLFEVRRLLEPAAAAMATTKVTPDDLATLTSMLEEVGPETSVEDLVAHDVKFHGLISELSGNAYLSTLLESLSGSTLRARIWRGLTEENSVERTLAEHSAIVDAMALGNADLVRSWVTVHISGVESWLLRAGQTAQGWLNPMDSSPAPDTTTSSDGVQGR
jgi:GntR family transcriptional repressor for pyruvate dehydrogenase complex